MAQIETAVLDPVAGGTAAVPAPNHIIPRPDSLSGFLPGWVRSKSWTAASGKTTQSLRMALPASFAQATQTAAYKFENDDASFIERLAEGTLVAGLFDGVTVPKRHHRAGHAVAAFVRERLRAHLVETDGRRPIVENVLASAIEEAVFVLDRLGGGAATTATVLVAVPMRTRDWRLYVINAGNSRATAFLPDGTVEPLTVVKPAGTSFAAVNTLTAGYRYRREASKVTKLAGTIVLLTSDGVHDHVPDSKVWQELGRAVEATLQASPSAGAVERLARTFAENTVVRATRAQEAIQRTDDATAVALVLGDPSGALDQKRPR
jgi:serine/threonine protein phosphatase PrpC